MVRFVFIRHGQALHNVGALLLGPDAYLRTDYRDAVLTDVGRHQASSAGDELRQYAPYNTIYCSPLRRCYQTLLAALPSAAQDHVKLDDRCMEPQGMHICNKRASHEEIAVSTPVAWDLKNVDRQHVYDIWPDADGYFGERIRRFTEDVMRSNSADATVLIVTHYEWIRMWFTMFCKETVSPKNAEVFAADVTP